MTFNTYLKICLQNDEFKQYWEADPVEEQLDRLLDKKAIWEALSLIEDSELQSILDNKGIKANTQISTTIEFYEEAGKCPVANFLNEITDQKLKTKVLRDILSLAVLGNSAREPLTKYIGDGIHELRTKQHNNIARTFYFFVFGNKIILTNGYIKKAQKMDEREFNKAKKYMKQYYER